MDLKSHSLYHLYGPKPDIDKTKISGLLPNSIWTCIGPKSRLNLKNFLTMYYLLFVKVYYEVYLSICVQEYAHVNS